MLRGERPHVVIIGGFLTEPVFYGRVHQRLLERGAARVTIAPIHLPDWLAMGFVGMDRVRRRAALTIRRARRESPEPLLVIGHSAGGIVARLAMAPAAIGSTAPSVAGDIGCLVTLGTPHTLQPRRWQHPGVRATEALARLSPGSAFAPATAYVTVGSTLVPAGAAAPTNPARRGVNVVMGGLVGSTPGHRGDGIVDDGACRLADARHVALPDVLHGTFGGPWYGDAHVIDRWWPVALEAWHGALDARSAPGLAIQEPLEHGSPRVDLATVVRDGGSGDWQLRDHLRGVAPS